MGYTHYFRGQNVTITPELVTDINNIIVGAMARGISIRNGLGEGEPIVNETEVILNGDASEDEDYETFSFTSGETTGGLASFCKTARKPYDAVVGAILLRLHETIPGFEFSSDGSFEEDSDWGKAKSLYLQVFGEEARTFEN